MKEYRKFVDGLPFIAQLLLVIFLDPIIWGIYRICKGDVLHIVVGIIWIFTVGLFGIGWLVDLVQVIVNKKVTFLA